MIQAKKVEITKHLIRPRIGWTWKVKLYQEGCNEVFWFEVQINETQNPCNWNDRLEEIETDNTPSGVAKPG